MKTIHLLGLISFLMLCACRKEIICSEPIPASPCSSDLICTADFRSVSVEVKDKQGNPVLLDKVISYRLSTGEEILVDDLKNQFMLDQGEYMVWSDGQKNITNKTGEQIQFVGFKNGTEVIRKNFTIGHDCCHIEKKEGPSELTVSVDAQ